MTAGDAGRRTREARDCIAAGVLGMSEVDSAPPLQREVDISTGASNRSAFGCKQGLTYAASGSFLTEMVRLRFAGASPLGSADADVRGFFTGDAPRW
jgi:hypothetical protein